MSATPQVMPLFNDSERSEYEFSQEMAATVGRLDAMASWLIRSHGIFRYLDSRLGDCFEDVAQLGTEYSSRRAHYSACSDKIAAAGLSASQQRLLMNLEDAHSAMATEEAMAAYLLGIAVGKQLAGGAR